MLGSVRWIGGQVARLMLATHFADAGLRALMEGADLAIDGLGLHGALNVRLGDHARWADVSDVFI